MDVYVCVMDVYVLGGRPRLMSAPTDMFACLKRLIEASVDTESALKLTCRIALM